jgi:Mg2+ and Co2+ transporter CorA
MMQDLLFYLFNYSGCIGIDDPCTVLLFALKIVASKFVVLIEYFDRMVNQSHRYMSRQSDLSNFAIAKVEAQWSDVQSLLRRTRKWRDALEGIITQLPVPKDLSTMSQVADWKDYHMDFQLLSQRLNSLCHSAEMLNMSITGLAGMAGNRQASEEQKLSLEATKRSIQEARSAKTLTMFGLVFIPLAYTASLFSMADPYGPGKDEFGSYFIVSFPLVTCVIAAYYVVDFGYTQDGRSWSFNNLVIALRKLISGLVERDAS